MSDNAPSTDPLVSRLVRERAERFAAPGELVAALTGSAEPVPAMVVPRPRRAPKSRSWGFWMGMGSGLLAGAMAMTVVIAPWRGGAEPPLLMQSFVADHARALSAHAETDLADGRPEAIAPWLAPVIGHAPPVPSLEDAGYELVGGRRDYAGAQPVGVVVYRHAGHSVDVFVLPEDARMPLVGPQEVGGFAAVAWRSPQLRFCAVSDLSAADLERFRDAFEAHAGARGA